jgi:uncharacterized protein YjgD (DUF1641 family)
LCKFNPFDNPPAIKTVSENGGTMAEPITLEIAPRDPRKELISRLEKAPAQHAEAILSAYEVLQVLHDRQVLETLRGFLGGDGKVLEIAVDAMNSPQSIRGIRNLVILAQTLGSIDPALLKVFAGGLPQALDQAKLESANPPGLWALFKRFCRRDSRRGLSVVNSLLETWGRNLAAEHRRSTE